MVVREERKDLLFEIGAEELPSGPLNAVIDQMQTLVPTLLEKAQLSFGGFSVYATPRRIAVLVQDIPVKVPDSVQEYKGPAVSTAYVDGDTSKGPTKALEGFARGKGVELSAIEIRSVDGTDYTFATVTLKGGLATDVLPALLGELLTSLEWKKTQRWGSSEARFARPVRWLVALFGSDVIPVTFGDLSSDRYTRGHRFMAPQRVELANAHEYIHVLKGNKVLVDQDRRRELIAKQAKEVSGSFGTVLLDTEVLDEVVNLTEHPNALLGTFDEEFLRAPRDILEYAMAKHQRYFAIERADKTLDNHFVVISNGDPAFRNQIIEGHERVVRARLADAVFFYDEDLKVPLEDWLSKLQSVVFQEKLGTTHQKVRRIEGLAEYLITATEVPADEATTALRAATLAKADLSTNAVIEFPNLQGVMGKYYALSQGEDDAVAIAIQEHYKPRFSGDAIPSTCSGQLVSVADKMDTIAGIFAVGKAPRGTSDPYALRRNAIGVLQIALQSLTLDLDALIRASLDQLVDVLDFDYEATYQAIRAFFTSRLETILRDEGHDYDVINAVLALSLADPADAVLRIKALEALKEHEDMINLSTAFARAKNLTDPAIGTVVDDTILIGPEIALCEALKETAAIEPELMSEKRYAELLVHFAKLRQPVDTFFESVMVMDEDMAIRNNRLALLNTLVSLIERFADLTQLVVKK